MSVCDFAYNLTESVFVFYYAASDNDSYVDDESSDSEPRPNRTPTVQQYTTRSNTIANIKWNGKHNKKLKDHRHSKSSITKNDLFKLYKNNHAGDSAKAYFGSLTQIAKHNQSEVEKKARFEAEKLYKPQLQKS